ncbi:MAG: GNAT family N-acetyltransferase [Candidatus Thermoplasmatota archaeon]|nr:GNAT family N-acetyltransferase [Candidatus Thermoplasmatota archaeon]
MLDRVNEFPVFPVLETDRLVLREITMDDLDWYIEHFSRPEMVEGQDFPAPESREVAEEELRKYIVDLFRNRDGFRWGVTLKGDPRLIGSLGYYKWARPWSHMAEMGYDLQKEHWGRGMMSEAMRAVIDFGFERMKLTRIEAFVFLFNTRSTRMLERLGFRREGILRSRVMTSDGVISDDTIYAMTRDDWLAARGRSKQ